MHINHCVQQLKVHMVSDRNFNVARKTVVIVYEIVQIVEQVSLTLSLRDIVENLYLVS